MSGTAGTLGWGALGAGGEAAAGTEAAVGVGATGLGEGVVAGALASNPIGWTILGLAAVGLAGWGLHKLYTAHVAHEQAEEEANSRTKTEPATRACAKCDEARQACAAFAAGMPGSKFRGGAHAATSLPAGDGLDSHHTPAAAATNLPRDMGPAIQMEPPDHWQTASNGRQRGFVAYIAAQKDLIASGNFMGAVAMDAADIHAKFGDKYDGALAQMLAYAGCLKRTGAVQ